MALWPGLDGEVGLSQSASGYTLWSSRLSILQDNCVECSRGEWGVEGDGEHGGGEGWEGETLLICDIGRHVSVVD